MNTAEITSIKKKLVAKFRAMPIRWARGDVDALTLAGLAVRGALLEATGIEPDIRTVARITFKYCLKALPNHRAKPRKAA